MAKLSVIIPSRDERFLTPTIHDVFRNATQEIEVIAVLDSNLWPEGWKEITDQYPNLHTIHNGRSLGMRASINRGVMSAVSRGAKFIMKSDGHCSFSEGFDEVLKAECERNWVVVPRRGRLDPENWTATETHKPDIDYHYLSTPNNPQDWGGPGLNGRPWPERAVERKDILLDEEMSSQGSCWFMHAAYFNELELMDDANYGPFWCEFQEIGLKCWLSGGKVMVNKKAKYLHLHKGTKYGRGYRLQESALQTGRKFTMLWPWNEAWPKQTLPFSWLIEHFWPVPSWPDNWEEILYATRKPRVIIQGVGGVVYSDSVDSDNNMSSDRQPALVLSLMIISAYYGPTSLKEHETGIDVTARLQALVRDNSLDIIVNNSTLTPDQNPFRGRKKQLQVAYAFVDADKIRQVGRLSGKSAMGLSYILNNSEAVTRTVEEKDWLIIGPVQERTVGLSEIDWSKVPPSKPESRIGVFKPLRPKQMIRVDSKKLAALPDGVIVGDTISGRVDVLPKALTTTAALNDYLIRKFSISPQRLRGPMPIELRDFHRNDLAQLFAELEFKRGAEIGVAEGNYSEVLLKANPECELHLVDPWSSYEQNPQNKAQGKHEYAEKETRRKVSGYPNVNIHVTLSMLAVETIEHDYLDYCYIDGNHLFDYVVQDLIEWSKRVRSGGIVSGDDYYALDQKRWVGGGVVEAVQAYVNAHRIPIWYIFQGHKSVDFMWVKP